VVCTHELRNGVPTREAEVVNIVVSMNTLSLRERKIGMEEDRIRKFPRWGFVLLSIAGSWVSGIFLGQVSIEGASVNNLVRVIAFGAFSLLMACGAIAKME
jgi:hypothetical protein